MTNPQYGPLPPVPPTPPPTAAKKHGRAFAITGVAVAAVALLCCGGAVLSVVGKDKPAKTAAITGASETPTKAPATEPAATATTAEAAAAETSATAAATTKAAAKPRVYRGRGDDVVDIPPLTDIAVVMFDCRCTSNTVLTSVGPESLLVNDIGAYKGKHWINVEEDAHTTQFEVQAAGRWTLTVGTIDQLARTAPAGKASGKGDDVVVLGGSATKARITHTKGHSNFVVQAYSLHNGEGGLLVNEIGGYSGTRPLNAPALVQITADGTWSITPA